MKKKILIGLGAFALAIVLTVNVKLVKNDQITEISLGELGTVTQAQAEGTGVWGALVINPPWAYYGCFCPSWQNSCKCVFP